MVGTNGSLAGVGSRTHFVDVCRSVATSPKAASVLCVMNKLFFPREVKWGWVLANSSRGRKERVGRRKERLFDSIDQY